LHGAGKGGHFPETDVVADALDEGERTVFLPDFAGFSRLRLVRIDLVFWDRNHKTGLVVGHRFSALADAAFRRPEISFSQGAEWKALISKYIGTIPANGDASCAAEQSISGGPPPTPVSSAMMAKVGAAARPSQPAAPRAGAWPLS
jgi:hypothetical protein